jgi:formylglycine-generating enzyme required for sulfatase activity
VQVGDADPVPLEQAIREGKVSITGHDGPGGRSSGFNQVSFSIAPMRVNNQTDKPVVVRVSRITPIGTDGQQPLGDEAPQLQGLSQRDLWSHQNRMSEEEREARLAPFREKATETYAVVPGTEWTNSIGMRFRQVPAGTFQMGSPVGEANRQSDETPH